MVKEEKMKKIITYCILLILIIGLIIGIKMKHNNQAKEKLTKITVAEVAHSVFYAPQYLADSLGYFKEKGLDVEITLSNGADAVIAAVLSKEADIGFCGTEATI